MGLKPIIVRGIPTIRVLRQDRKAKIRKPTLERVAPKIILARQKARQRKRTVVAKRKAKQSNVQNAVAAMKAAKKISNLRKATKRQGHYKPRAQR